MTLRMPKRPIPWRGVGSAGRWLSATVGCLLLASAVAGMGPTLLAHDSPSTGAAHWTVAVTPVLQVAPTQGPSGSAFSVDGMGFTASASANVTFNRTALTPLVSSGSNCDFTGPVIITNATGGFVCTFSVPVLSPGSYNVTGYDISTLTPSANVLFQVDPSLSINPDQGSPGSSFTGTGTGFSDNGEATVAFNGGFLSPTACSVGNSVGQLIGANATGAFTCTFKVPSEAPGPYDVVAQDLKTSIYSLTVVFTVSAPAISVTPGQGPVSSTVTVSGTGFSASTPLASLVFDDVSISYCASGSLTTDPSGTFTCDFLVPTGTSGSTVVATNIGGRNATGTFVVTVPSIADDPAQGPVGAQFAVSGSGFTVDSGASVAFNGLDLTPTGCSVGTSSATTITTSGTGSFSCSFTVTSTAPGQYGIVGTDIETSSETATISFTVTALTISVTPGAGPVGTPVSVSGTGFSVSTNLAALIFDGVFINSCASGSLATDGTGAFTCGLAVPTGTSGTTVSGTDVGGQSATTSFTVTTPAVQLSPAEGSPGSTFSVTATGFVGAAVTLVTLNGNPLSPTGCSLGSSDQANVTTDSSGAFVCQFVLPNEPGGVSTITVAQGANSPSANFEVTPFLTLSQPNGTVGSTVVVHAVSFLGSTPYSLQWNASTTLCVGTTGSFGQFSCLYSVPNAAAGLHTLEVVQGSSIVGTPFDVVPSLSLSAMSGSVGSTITLLGFGFDAGATYSVSWGGSSSQTLCSGTTNTNGGITCAFTVPTSGLGSFPISVKEGTYTPSVLFTVSAGSSPSPAGFPWWVVVVIAVVAAVLLLALITLERGRPAGSRRRGPHRGGAPVHPWGGAAADPTAGLGPSSVGAGAGGVSMGSGATPLGDDEPVEDIDVLIARLEKISLDMFKKRPKELLAEDVISETGTPSPPDS